ncbi:MAG: nucleotidyltransferase family protein [Hyphomonadaceae bacterium]
MKPRPAPSNPDPGDTAGGGHIVGGGRREADLLAMLAGAGLQGRSIPLPVNDSIDWDLFIQLAHTNRMLILAARGISLAAAPPQALRTGIARYRELTLRYNGALLAALKTVNAAFETARVETVVVKGPIAQIGLYGQCFMRPSTDIDLLVRRRDFARASEVLTGLGYSLPAGCDSYWWRHFLGEQHFLHPSLPAVDLHHRVQQPGCPSPRPREMFIDMRATQDFGGQAFPVLPPDLACLMSCISLVKGVLHREASGAHACDVYMHFQKHSQSERAALQQMAKSLGQGRTMLAGWRIACALFEPAGRSAESADVLPSISDAQLRNAVLRPGAPDSQLPRRARILSELCDSRSSFSRELAWSYSADLVASVLGRG